MTKEEVLARVEKIREIAVDDEAAHIDEDQLHQEVLLYIARSDKDGVLGGLCQAALETTTIDFARWCA